MNRRELMNECPEDFKDTLESFLDDIEAIVDDIKDNLNITSTSDLENVPKAEELAIKLGDILY